jgi:hypothetical protein
MIETDPADSFDLPGDCDPDHVVIYEQEDPYQPPYYAVPFYHVDTWDDGTREMQEPDQFSVTEEYREAVAERAEMDIEDVKLRREIATYTFEEVEPL